MIPVNFRLTTAGAVAAWNNEQNGFDLSLTHVQFGSGNKIIDGSETALIDPRQACLFASNVLVSPTQRRFTSVASGSQQYGISEIGLWQGDPAVSGSVLAFYWSQADGVIGAKYPASDFIFQHDLSFGDAIPEGGINIIVDDSALAAYVLMQAHEAHDNPHPAYLKTSAADVRYALKTDLNDVSNIVAGSRRPAFLCYLSNL